MSAQSTMTLHKGGRLVSPEQLASVPTPQAEGRWHPIAHSVVLQKTKEILIERGYEIQRERLALARNDARFFATLDLANTLSEGVNLAVAIRSSTDKSLPLGFAAGSRVWICDNGNWSSELMYKRKHTRYGAERFQHDLACAVVKLGQFKEAESKKIEALKKIEVTDTAAESLLLRAFERGILTAPMLPRVIREYREPTYNYGGEERSFWRLLNSCTTIAGEAERRNPLRYLTTTIRLQALLFAEPALKALAL